MSDDDAEDGGVRRVLYRRRQLYRHLRSKIPGGRESTSDVDKLLHALRLPREAEETAVSLYRKAVETHTIRGRNMETLLAAAAYAACRQRGVPLTLDDIAERSGIGRREVGKSFRWLAHELGLRLTPASPLDYLDRFCQQLHAGECIRSTARDVLQRAERREMTSGRGATGMAAAAIYVASMMCGEKITQRDIAGVTGVTEVTVRNRYKELVRELNLDVDG